MPFVINVIGSKHAGKTRLIELLVPCLKSRGASVGTIKYAECDRFAWERPGTETVRHKSAGSDVTGIFGATASAVQYAKTFKLRCKLESMIRTYYCGVDVVLIEGLCSQGHKVEVCRLGFTDTAVGDPNELWATYGDRLLTACVPHFAFGSEFELADLLIERSL